MVNERLRASIHAAGLTLQDLSAQIQVDPKTVERWIATGRVPHRRNRQSVAQALHRSEDFLWSGSQDEAASLTNAEAELIQIYPTRGHIPSSTWTSLLDNCQQSIDVLAFAGSFLHDAVPQFTERLRNRATAGVSIRLLFGDPNSEAVQIRGQEEGIGESLAERCRLTWKYLESLEKNAMIARRKHATTLYSSIYRFDDEMLLNHHGYGAAASQSHVLRLRKTAPGVIFEQNLRCFDRVWDSSDPC